MLNLKTFANFKFESNVNSYVFLNSNGSLVTGAHVRAELKNSIKKLGISGKDLSTFKPHSLRYGEITDLFAAGVEPWLVKKYARHTPDSKITFHYTRLQSEEEADLVEYLS